MIRAELLLEGHSVLLSIIAMYLLDRKNNRSDSTMYVLRLILCLVALLMASDMVSIYYRGKTGPGMYYLLWTSNSLVYVSQHLLVVLVNLYVGVLIYRDRISNVLRTRWLLVMQAVALLAIILVDLNLFFGYMFYIDPSTNLYSRGRWFFLTLLLGGINMLISLLEVFKHRKELNWKEFHSIASFYVFPAIGIIIQSIWYGLSLMNIGISLSVFLLIHRYNRMRRARNHEIEIKVEQRKAYLLHTQINTSLMHNYLAGVKELIEEDPYRAEESISHFSQFLRVGMNLKSVDKCVPLKEEIEYTRNYLHMEKVHMKEQLDFVIDIEDGDEIVVPFLSIQPLVQDAVRYGVGRIKEGSGTVTVRGRHHRKGYMIEVIDDADGFDVDHVLGYSRDYKVMSQGMGINFPEIESRVKLMCEGEMHIESVFGEGTRITMYLPSLLR